MPSHDQAASVAAIVLELRRGRSQVLPSRLFGEPAWDLLLELFVADAKGERLTGGEVSERCGISPAVLSRWLMVLTQERLIVGDGTGNLDDELTLSASALESLEHLMEKVRDQRHALGV